MAFFYPLRIYHHPDVIIIDGIEISRESTSAIQNVVTLGHYQPTRTSMLQEIDDMTTRVLEGPPSSPTQYASVMRKVQTIICRCMVSIGAIASFPWEPLPERGAHGVKRGAHMQIPNMEEREEEDLADGDVEIQAHMFHLTHSTAQT
ncbi:hypothetical protein M9H77_08675 [Catharanthus roseus]|uniref:Uncharacterized protein n=1 Tax=Catharanthus roseus TaxID=4058 RepID=A0ACC0BYI7_CATRO|nr:hypothetical protein M9H77_08675 [Catharanthus roseus]